MPTLGPERPLLTIPLTRIRKLPLTPAGVTLRTGLSGARENPSPSSSCTLTRRPISVLRHPTENGPLTKTLVL